MKIYQIIIQDEYNNLYHIGFYKQLKDCINDINSFLEIYNVKIEENDLKEYPSTFSSCIDLCLSDLFDDIEPIMIRGFIFENMDAIIKVL